MGKQSLAAQSGEVISILIISHFSLSDAVATNMVIQESEEYEKLSRDEVDSLLYETGMRHGLQERENEIYELESIAADLRWRINVFISQLERLILLYKA
jgi:hypothetical protein